VIVPVKLHRHARCYCQSLCEPDDDWRRTARDSDVTSTPCTVVHSDGDWSGTLPGSGSQLLRRRPSASIPMGSVAAIPRGGAIQPNVTAVSPALRSRRSGQRRSWEENNAALAGSVRDRLRRLRRMEWGAARLWIPDTVSHNSSIRTITWFAPMPLPSDQKDASITVGTRADGAGCNGLRMNETHDGVLITANGVTYHRNRHPRGLTTWALQSRFRSLQMAWYSSATANTDGSYGNELYALDAQTGAVVWGPVAVSGTYFGSGLTYENGRVFLLMFDGGLPCLQCVERRSAFGLCSCRVTGMRPHPTRTAAWCSSAATRDCLQSTRPANDSLERTGGRDDRLGLAGGVVGRRVYAGRLRLQRE